VSGVREQGIEPGQFVRVANRPPYRHPSARGEYFAARGEVVCGGRSQPVELLFTPTEIHRAARRAQRNREDVPPERRRGLLESLMRLIGGPP
jgi:hypothetical protein